MQKWEYALVTFKKGATKAKIVRGNGVVEESKTEEIRTSLWGDDLTNALKINFLTKLGNQGWEIIDILDNDQMFLKREV